MGIYLFRSLVGRNQVYFLLNDGEGGTFVNILAISKQRNVGFRIIISCSIFILDQAKLLIRRTRGVVFSSACGFAPLLFSFLPGRDDQTLLTLSRDVESNVSFTFYISLWLFSEDVSPLKVLHLFWVGNRKISAYGEFMMTRKYSPQARVEK